MSDPGDRDEVRVRRAPKFGAFLAAGGGLGAIGAFVATAVREVDPEVGFLQMFLLLALFGVTIGMLLGAILALVFDRLSSRRSSTVAAEHTEVTAPVHPNVAEPAIEALPEPAQDPGDDAAPVAEDRPEEPPLRD